MNPTSDWFTPALHQIAAGAWFTLLLAVASVVISVFVGIVFGLLLCLPDGRWTTLARWLLTVYLQLFRGLPTIVTLFIVFFVAPSLGLDLDPFWAGVVGLSLWGSANVMAVVSGAVQSIPKGQSEAAQALGFGWVAVMRWVLMPQATKRMLPPVVNLLVDLIQATTLASLIGVVEILQKSRQVVEFYQLSAGSAHAAPIFGGVLLVFFIICYPLTLLAGRVERRGTRVDRQPPSKDAGESPAEPTLRT